MYNNKLYNTTYHNIDLSKHAFLVTGGAGFIGSNLVEYLLRFGAGRVRVLDNLSNGYFENIKDFLGLPNFEFVEGDIRDLETCKRAVEGVHFISHQAALGSVPRSISDPLLSNEVNVSGFLNMLVAAKESPSLKQMVYAASSSTYGDSPVLPKVEGNEGNPLSPYAVTKLVNELYADVFSKVYGFHTIGLRYFNIFGPKQNANNPYAAVIPIFCKHFIEGTEPMINGDGETSRDFTFVENAVQANVKMMLIGEDAVRLRSGEAKKPRVEEVDVLISEALSVLATLPLSKHEVFNVACGDQISLNEMVEMLCEISGKRIKAVYGNERPGDVKHSKASIAKLEGVCGYDPNFRFKEGLEIVYEWYNND
ncbi:SDR family oxidoreductase [Belliella sp. R4-6]|uniref:SDR family oxidoreductase n=1 Tax=Belliella alkalica TaxID=1730871 RepID=A0ABS9V7Z3_9BACT|nr:SDR family oxidoreductase [Belliella alkalica]MCH7412073.1 SDR family oxidoreductase [Belliella alkalica]